MDGDYLVALRFLPNIELIVTLMALAKIGLAYVPIAPNWPAGRVKMIFEDAKPSLVITNTKVDILYKAMDDEFAQNNIRPKIFQESLGTSLMV